MDPILKDVYDYTEDMYDITLSEDIDWTAVSEQCGFSIKALAEIKNALLNSTKDKVLLLSS